MQKKFGYLLVFTCKKSEFAAFAKNKNLLRQFFLLAEKSLLTYASYYYSDDFLFNRSVDKFIAYS